MAFVFHSCQQDGRPNLADGPIQKSDVRPGGHLVESTCSFLRWEVKECWFIFIPGRNWKVREEYSMEICSFLCFSSSSASLLSLLLFFLFFSSSSASLLHLLLFFLYFTSSSASLFPL